MAAVKSFHLFESLWQQWLLSGSTMALLYASSFDTTHFSWWRYLQVEAAWFVGSVLSFESSMPPGLWVNAGTNWRHVIGHDDLYLCFIYIGDSWWTRTQGRVLTKITDISRIFRVQRSHKHFVHQDKPSHKSESYLCQMQMFIPLSSCTNHLTADPVTFAEQISFIFRKPSVPELEFASITRTVLPSRICLCQCPCPGVAVQPVAVALFPLDDHLAAGCHVNLQV